MENLKKELEAIAKIIGILKESGSSSRVFRYVEDYITNDDSDFELESDGL